MGPRWRYGDVVTQPAKRKRPKRETTGKRSDAPSETRLTPSDEELEAVKARERARQRSGSDD
jgi:hypothetical protein